MSFCHVNLGLISLRALFSLLLASTVFTAVQSAAFPQQSSERRVVNEAAIPSGPAAALRDVLSAACTQDQKQFASTLTARNADAFAHLTPAARSAFLKRFVLLNEPGKASVLVNPAGRPTVRCETPDVATEMQIGGADVRDNIAFLPVELRNAADPSAGSLHRVTIGMVRENSQWKLLSLGLLLLDLPALSAEWDKAESNSNESAAIEALKNIADAIETYRKAYARLPDSLNSLGPALHGPPSVTGAGLLDEDLAAGRKNGYVFRYVIVGGNSAGAPAKYELSATPATYDRTGMRSFFRDSVGVLHAADHEGAVGSAGDPRLN
ncbi:MAG TPA: hypothetical protein VFF42_05570 [Candidatus Eremiobacteraceae bacterium]|nr:hypothetical protein [Candidatus Eremiobacteraceae bacterium]